MGQTNDVKKRPGRTGKNATHFNKSAFVQYELSNEQKAAVKAQQDDGDKLFESLDTLLSMGYKLTLRFDNYSDSMAAWLIAPDDHKPNGGKVLPGRGSTPLKAVKQVLYKHFEVFDGVWPEVASRKEFEDMDD